MSPLARVGVRTSTRVWTALFLVAALPLTVLAQPQAPPPPQTFFTDTTGVVPAQDAAQIESRLREFQTESSNQVLVVVADKVPEGYAGVEEYANRTAEAWRVGDKSRDNGAVVFLFVGERKVRIEVGYGLEGALPDALASRIINDEMTKHFREGQYGAGLLAGVDAIIRATKGEYQPIASAPSTNISTFNILLVLFFLFSGVVLPFLRAVRGHHDSRTYSGRGANRKRTRNEWSWTWGGGGWSGGSGGGSFGGGGGGFSGGGGSFGGGGASGSW